MVMSNEFKAEKNKIQSPRDVLKSRLLSFIFQKKKKKTLLGLELTGTFNVSQCLSKKKKNPETSSAHLKNQYKHN